MAMGRPSKLTPELQEAICKSLQFGVDRDTACAREKLSRATLYAWLKRGERWLQARAAQDEERDESAEPPEPPDPEDEPYAEFVIAIQAAEAKVEIAVTSTILSAAKRGDWRAALSWLRFRKTGFKQQVEVSGVDGKPLGLLTNAAADEIRRKILYGDDDSTDGKGEP